MNLLHLLLSALTISVGVWGLFHQGFKGVEQMAKFEISPTGESGPDTNRMTMLIDSGASEHYFDDELHPGRKDNVLSYKGLERPYKIVIAGRHVLLGTATGTESGVIADENGIKHRVDLPGLVVPGLGHDFSLASQAVKTGLGTIIDYRPRLEQGQHALPLQQLDKNQDIFSFDLGFVLAPMASEPSGNTTALSDVQAGTEEWDTSTPNV